MSYAADHIIADLKAARDEQKLSQRALGAKAGVPQSHISRIESGAVDVQLSSLIELARNLDSRSSDPAKRQGCGFAAGRYAATPGLRPRRGRRECLTSRSSMSCCTAIRSVR
jgi:transcriptional regulator with XRE-family HTH domain